MPALLTASMLAAPAAAQEFVPPRFEGLEQQQQMHDQRRLDDLEAQRRDLQMRSVTTGQRDPAGTLIEDTELRRQQNRLRLERAERMAAERRESAIAETRLPNRRIAAHSTLVVRDPESRALPPAPDGQFYAEIDGRLVLVDATSELVVQVLEQSELTKPQAVMPISPTQNEQPY